MTAQNDQMPNFLPETETTVPIIRGPGEGKVVGVLRDQSTFKVTSEETGGGLRHSGAEDPAGTRAAAPCSPPRNGDLLCSGGRVRDHHRRAKGDGHGRRHRGRSA